MADTKTQRSTAAKAAATPRRRTAASSPKTAVNWTADLSEDVLEAVEIGQRAAIEAVRTFFGTVDEALPEHVETAKGQGPVDSALQMADRLVHINYDFIRKVIDRAGKSL